MFELTELYQELILDHGRRPRNFQISEEANHILEGFNPLCGDKLTLYLTEKEGKIQKITFQGTGCAISIASASLMTEALENKSIEEASALFDQFHALVVPLPPVYTRVNSGENPEKVDLGKLKVLAGVSQFPSRVKCATLAWHTLRTLLHNENLEDKL